MVISAADVQVPVWDRLIGMPMRVPIETAGEH